MDNILLRIYLPIYLTLYMLVAFVIPTYRTYKSTGINPITFGKADNPHDYIGFIMKILIALLFVSVMTFAINEEWYNYLSPIKFLEKKPLVTIGLFIIHISLIWISIAQYQMSTSWRIGIDEKNKTKLVTTGIFGISRNPIFLGMIISMLGIFFILPNALTFCLVLTTYIVIHIQIRLEEEFLQKQHGEEYLRYRERTKRLI
jgi:protein-S-isoprenylcysteine O-methyltransferase Ste14